MSTNAVVTDPSTQLARIIDDGQIEAGSAAELRRVFGDILLEADTLARESATIVVTDATQVTAMKQARAQRLKIRQVRITAENERKRFKEDALRVGKCIDGIANLVKGMCEPAESRLEEMEKFAERAEAQRKAAIKVEREAYLRPLGVDCTAYKLDEMSDTAFDELAAGAKLARDAKIERERKEQAEREAAEVARAVEQTRIREENARLQAERDEAQRLRREAEKAAADERAEADRKLREEREERQRLENEARARDVAEMKRKQAEEKAARAAAMAPDREKILAMAQSIEGMYLGTEPEQDGSPFYQAHEILAVAVADLRRLAASLAQ